MNMTGSNDTSMTGSAGKIIGTPMLISVSNRTHASRYDALANSARVSASE